MRVMRLLSIIVVGWFVSGALMPSVHGQAGTPTATGVTRTYYIAADELDWNYTPDIGHASHVLYGGKQARRYIDNGPENVGSVYRKVVYREYTDARFSTLKPRPPQWEHLGLLGPLIRGEVGDTIKIVFKNNAKFLFSIHAHGVRYEQSSDGTEGVPTGATFTYTWEVVPQAGPQAGEPSSKFWMYHSHANEQRDGAAGLTGPIIVSAKGTVKADGTPKDVDREFVQILYTINESQSWYLDQNIATYIRDPKSLRKTGQVSRDIDGQPVDVGFQASNVRETINGYMFADQPGLVMKQGEKVRWYTGGQGQGTHTVHWHGNTALLDGKSVDVVSALPLETHTSDMVAENPGIWMFHCHLPNHVLGGMYTHYTVLPKAATSSR